MKEKKSAIQSIDRAAAVLEIISRASVPMRNSEIAEVIGLPVKTVHHIVRSLYINGYLAQEPDGKYLIGPAALALVRPIQKKYERLQKNCSGILKRLSRETRCITFLGVDYYGKLYCPIMATSNGDIEVCGRQSWLDSFHAIAPGILLIGAKGIDWFRSVTKEPLKQFTEKTIVDMDQIAIRVEECLKKGYCMTHGEHVERYSELAVPIKNSHGEITAALASCFLETHWRRKLFDPQERLDQLRDVAAMISDYID